MQNDAIGDPKWIDHKYCDPHPFRNSLYQHYPMIEVFVCQEFVTINAVWGRMDLDSLKNIEEDLLQNDAFGIPFEQGYTAMLQITGYENGDREAGMSAGWMWKELWRITTREELALDGLQEYLVDFDSNIDIEDTIPF